MQIKNYLSSTTLEPRYQIILKISGNYELEISELFIRCLIKK